MSFRWWNLFLTKNNNSYPGTLANGEQVWVKYRYPKIRSKVDRDARMLSKTPASAMKIFLGDQAKPLVEGFTALVARQCDYEAEMRHTQAFYNLFKDHPDIWTPIPYPEHSNSYALVVQHMGGQDYLSYLELANTDQKQNMARRLTEFMFKSMAAGLFYYDVHPGNFAFTDEAMMVIDFGGVVPIREGVGDILEAIIDYEEGNFDRIRQRIVTAGHVEDKDSPLHENLLQATRDLYLAPWLTDSPFLFDRHYVGRVFHALQKGEIGRGIKVAKGDATASIRFYLSFYAMLGALDCNFNWRQLIDPWIAQRKGERQRSAG